MSSKQQKRAARAAAAVTRAATTPPVVQFDELPPLPDAGPEVVETTPTAAYTVVPPREPDPEDEILADQEAPRRRGGQFSARRIVFKNRLARSRPPREVIVPMMPVDAYKDRAQPGDEVINGERRPGQPLGEEIAFDSEEERDDALTAHGWRRNDPLHKNDLDSTKPPTI